MTSEQEPYFLQAVETAVEWVEDAKTTQNNEELRRWKAQATRTILDWHFINMISDQIIEFIIDDEYIIEELEESQEVMAYFQIDDHLASVLKSPYFKDPIIETDIGYIWCRTTTGMAMYDQHDVQNAVLDFAYSYTETPNPPIPEIDDEEEE